MGVLRLRWWQFSYYGTVLAARKTILVFVCLALVFFGGVDSGGVDPVSGCGGFWRAQRRLLLANCGFCL